MNTQELKQACIDLMETAQVAYLTTILPDGYPCTRAVFNLRNKQQFPNQAPLFAKHQDDLLIYISTNTSSHKLEQIKANAKVSVYYCKPEQFHGLMLSGDIEIMDDTTLRHALWNEGWERYYPGGPDDPDHTVLCLKPRSIQGWHEGSRFELNLSES